MSTIGDVAKFRYANSGELIEVTGFFYLCDSKLNELLRTKDNLDANSPVFYAVLMVEKGAGESQRNIHFKFDKHDTIYYMEAASTAPNTAGAYMYKCIFFSEAKFIYMDEGYPALENWHNNGTEPTTKVSLFKDWVDYQTDKKHKFISTLEHTKNFYH